MLYIKYYYFISYFSLLFIITSLTPFPYSRLCLFIVNAERAYPYLPIVQIVISVASLPLHLLTPLAQLRLLLIRFSRRIKRISLLLPQIKQYLYLLVQINALRLRKPRKNQRRHLGLLVQINDSLLRFFSLFLLKNVSLSLGILYQNPLFRPRFKIAPVSIIQLLQLFQAPL